MLVRCILKGKRRNRCYWKKAGVLTNLALQWESIFSLSLHFLGRKCSLTLSSFNKWWLVTCKYWSKADKNKTGTVFTELHYYVSDCGHTNFPEVKNLFSYCLSSSCTNEVTVWIGSAIWLLKAYTVCIRVQGWWKLLSEPRLTLMSWFMQMGTIMYATDTVGRPLALQREKLGKGESAPLHLERIPPLPFVGHDLHCVDSFSVNS